jgi:hypothetical protein
VTSLSLSLAGGQVLTAAASTSAEDRVRKFLLVPWGVPGRTNLGPKKVHRGAIQLTAQAKLVGIYGHGDRERSVSRVIDLEDTEEGLVAQVRIGRTPLGDQLLVEIDDGVRDALSVELDSLEFDSAGDVVSGRLDFYAHVPVGAYDSAVVLAAAAAIPSNGETVTQPSTLEPATQPAPALSPEQFAQLLAGLQAAAQPAPAGSEPSAAALLGVSGVPATPAAGSEVDLLAEAGRLTAGLHASAGTDQQLLAALADITATGLPLFQSGGGRLGEKLWEGAGYERQFVQLMRPKELKAMRYYGWQWTKRPKVAAWDGDKTQVPTDTVSLEQVPFDARRCAGGWDVDRKYKDFGDAEFWEEFYSAQTESYQELSDTWAAEGIVAAARDVSVDANLSTLPADYATLVDATGVPAGPTQLLRAAAIGRVILEGTPRVKQGPDYILVNPIDWLELADLTALDLPAFLALLKVDPSKFLPTIQVPKGRVILGVKNAMTFRELGGGSPIRVEALDVARGGIDSAVYGYVGISLERAGGVISVPLAAAA